MVKEECPVCGKGFLNSAYGSWFQWGEPDRDFKGSFFAANLGTVTCPYCLFTAQEMERLSPEVRKRLRAALARLPEGLVPLTAAERERRRNDPTATGAVHSRLVDLCNAQMAPDSIRDAELGLINYYGSQAEATRGAATRRAIAALQKVADDEKTARERPDLVYLLGELQRRAGQTKAASATLARAAKLAGAENEGIRTWALEQRRLAQRGITKAGDRSDESEDSESDAERMVRKRLPKFLAALRAGRPEGEWLVPAATKWSDRANDTLNAVNKLAERGNRDAIEYVLRWLGQVELAKVDDYPEPYCLQALARQPEIGRAILPGITFRFDRMADAARYACGMIPCPPVTAAALRGRTKWLPTDDGILMAATIRRDPALKAVLLSRAVNGERWPSHAESYLSSVVTSEDIPAIERRIRWIWHPRDVSVWDERTEQRGGLEGVLLGARLSELAGQLE